MTPPLFSVIVPVYNNENYLAGCFDSVLNQDGASFELILVEDKSPNQDAADIVRKYNSHSAVKTVWNPRNEGIVGATNIGIQAARGKYIVFLDCDDEMKVDALKTYKQIIHNFDAPDYIFSGKTHQFPDGSVEDGIYPFENGVMNHATFRRRLITNMVASHLKAIKSEMVRKCGLLDRRWENIQDWDYALRCLQQGARFYHHKGSLYLYRFHDNSFSTINQTLMQRMTNQRRLLEQKQLRIPRRTSDDAEYYLKEEELTDPENLFVLWEAGYNLHYTGQISNRFTLQTLTYCNSFIATLTLLNPFDVVRLMGAVWNPHMLTGNNRDTYRGN